MVVLYLITFSGDGYLMMDSPTARLCGAPRAGVRALPLGPASDTVVVSIVWTFIFKKVLLSIKRKNLAFIVMYL